MSRLGPFSLGVPTPGDLPQTLYHDKPGVTKHYYAAGQRIASRVNGELYYTLNEPTGLATVFADAAGQRWDEDIAYTYKKSALAVGSKIDLANRVSKPSLFVNCFWYKEIG